jgi:hypothetical protein
MCVCKKKFYPHWIFDSRLDITTVAFLDSGKYLVASILCIVSLEKLTKRTTASLEDFLTTTRTVSLFNVSTSNDPFFIASNDLNLVNVLKRL